MFLYLFEHLIEFGFVVIGYLSCILNCVIFVLDMFLILAVSLILQGSVLVLVLGLGTEVLGLGLEP